MIRLLPVALLLAAHACMSVATMFAALYLTGH